MYFYSSHMGGIYTSKELVDAADLYCETCGDSDWLIGEADTFAKAFRLLRSDSFTMHYDLGYIHSLLCKEFGIANHFPVTENNESTDASDEEILREIHRIVDSDKWIERWTPGIEDINDMPCVMVAVNSALGACKNETDHPILKDDGYCTLQNANKYIRKYLPVKKRIDYKRGARPKLKDLPIFEPAIVCVLGHYLYWHGNGVYESCFDNKEDDVVSVWILDQDM